MYSCNTLSRQLLHRKELILEPRDKFLARITMPPNIRKYSKLVLDSLNGDFALRKDNTRLLCNINIVLNIKNILGLGAINGNSDHILHLIQYQRNQK